MFPDLNPLDSSQREMLQKGLSNLRPEQLVWLSGYLSGRASSFLPQSEHNILPSGAFEGDLQASANLTTPQQTVATPVEVLVLYGTESGNAESLADKFFKKAKKSGFKPTLKNMADISPSDLKKHKNIFTLVSTWGDGEPPESAEAFHKAFMSEDLDLSGTNYSVLALGDTSYEKFCQTGKDFDARFEALGATKLVDREDCDLDFEENYANWSNLAFLKLEEQQVAPTPAPASSAVFEEVTSTFDKSNPFPAEVLANINLNGTGSSKETLHLELSLEGSNLTYEVGDALAVIPENAEDVMKDFLDATPFTGKEVVDLKNIGLVDLRTALKKHLDITALSRKVIKGYQQLTDSATLAEILDEKNKPEFKDFLNGRQIIDLLKMTPYEGSAQDLVSILRKLPPRLYSIASSIKAHEDEVHLTVAAVRYEAYGMKRKGVASTFIADDCKPGDKVLVYVHKNKNFRLPADSNTPIIMVGPGTGVAPFRAFVEERAETSAKGESWLFFGDQHYSYDFLYQLEWQDHLKEGNLTKLDVAFSRDQKQKVYVQHKMLENAADLWDWLANKNASFYVCGDAERMAGDVHNALLSIAQSEGKLSESEAEEFLKELKSQKRYQRDVY